MKYVRGTSSARRGRIDPNVFLIGTIGCAADDLILPGDISGWLRGSWLEGLRGRIFTRIFDPNLIPHASEFLRA